MDIQTGNAAGQSGASNVVHLYSKNTSKFTHPKPKRQTSRLLLADNFAAYHRLYEETKSPAILEAWILDRRACLNGGVYE